MFEEEGERGRVRGKTFILTKATMYNKIEHIQTSIFTVEECVTIFKYIKKKKILYVRHGNHHKNEAGQWSLL